MVLASQLKSLIKKRGVTVVALARATGVPTKTLYSWLQNQSPRNLDQIRKIADYFQVSLEFLLFNEVKTKEPNFEDYKEEIYAGTYEVVLRKVRKD